MIIAWFPRAIANGMEAKFVFTTCRYGIACLRDIIVEWKVINFSKAGPNAPNVSTTRGVKAREFPEIGEYLEIFAFSLSIAADLGLRWDLQEAM